MNVQKPGCYQMRKWAMPKQKNTSNDSQKCLVYCGTITGTLITVALLIYPLWMELAPFAAGYRSWLPRLHRAISLCLS